MKKALFAALAALATATVSFADTITWTGGAGTTDYATAGNWDLDRAPAETDDVVIDGAAVTVDGNSRIPLSLTLSNGASWSIGGQIWFGNDANGVVHPVIQGGTVSGTLVAGQTAGATLTISDAQIIDTGTDFSGFWQPTGSYLNFVDGDNRAATFTYQTSIAANPFWFFSNPANTPYIRYNDQVIDEATFNRHFTYVDNGDGTTTLSMKSVDGWELGALTVGVVNDHAVDVSVTATKYSGSNATVYFVQGARDYGETFASWPTATDGVAVSATGEVNDTLTLEDGYNYIRAFLLYNGEYTASAVVTRRIMAPYGDYGDLTNVYEYIGEDNDLTKASNWVKDGLPTETAPTAGTDIRWFGYNAVLSVNGFSAYATDHFVGANITSVNDFNVYSDLVFSNSTITATMFVLRNDGKYQFKIAGSTMVQTRTDDGWYGIYYGDNYAAFNFVSGQAASFNGKAPANITADNLYSQHVANNHYILLDGAAIDSETWDEHFAVEMLDNGHVIVSYNPSVDDNRISAVSATSTSTSATISATIGAQAAGTLVKLAYGTTAPSEADVLSGTMMTVENATATATLSGLTEFTTYYYLVAIVDANGTGILASRAGKFVASNFSHIYDGTSWVVGGEPAWGTDASVLITGTFSTGEINPENKVLRDAVMTGTTLANGSGPLTLINSTYTNNKQNDLANGVAAYGIYNNSYAVNFTTASSDGVIKRGNVYTCYATEAQCGTVYENLFATGKMKLNGETVSQALFDSNFTTNVVVTELFDGETILNRLTLTYWESVLGGGSSTDWTIQPGARVKLDKDTRVGALNIPDAADVKIDLNGHKLTVSSLTVGGVTMKGEFTSATLGCLTGDGSLSVAGNGLVIVIR